MPDPVPVTAMPTTTATEPEIVATASPTALATAQETPAPTTLATVAEITAAPTTAPVSAVTAVPTMTVTNPLTEFPTFAGTEEPTSSDNSGEIIVSTSLPTVDGDFGDVVSPDVPTAGDNNVGVGGVTSAPSPADVSTDEPTVAATITSSEADTPRDNSVIVPSRLRFGFFDGADLREPTPEELDVVVFQMNEFYTQLLTAGFPDSFAAYLSDGKCGFFFNCLIKAVVHFTFLEYL